MGRQDIYETQSSFIKKANEAWKASSDFERESFLNASPPKPTKTRISFFFPVSTSSSSSSASSKVELKRSPPSTTQLQHTSPTVNAASAIQGREAFLTEREMEMIKQFF